MPEITQYEAQKKIAVVWFVFSAIILITFAVISIPRSATAGTEPVEWLIGFLSPGLTLITSVFIYAFSNQAKLQTTIIDPFFLKLVRGSSIFYLAIILAILLLTPLAEGHDISFLVLLKKFSLFLSFIQALVLSLLGIFFVKQQASK